MVSLSELKNLVSDLKDLDISKDLRRNLIHEAYSFPFCGCIPNILRSQIDECFEKEIFGDEAYSMITYLSNQDIASGMRFYDDFVF